MFGIGRRRHDQLTDSVLTDESNIPVIERVVILFAFALLMAFISWATYMQIDEIAMCPGQMEPTGNVKKVQHQRGGVIQRIYVKDGDLVASGQKLVLLEGSQFFTQIAQIKRQIETFKQKHAFLKEEIAMKTQLVEKRLEPKASLLALKVDESDIQARLEELQGTYTLLKDEIDRLVIRSPSEGYVHKMRRQTLGEVITPGETIMEIVPADQRLIATVQISTKDIGHVKVGQTATLRFTNYDFVRFGGIQGILTEISATTILDGSGTPYYKGMISLENEQLLERLKKVFPILPGMTIIADIKTGSKSLAEYLLKPIHQSATKALHER